MCAIKSCSSERQYACWFSKCIISCDIVVILLCTEMWLSMMLSRWLIVIKPWVMLWLLRANKFSSHYVNGEWRIHGNGHQNVTNNSTRTRTRTSQGCVNVARTIWRDDIDGCVLSTYSKPCLPVWRPICTCVRCCLSWVGNSWRIADDIQDNYDSFVRCLNNVVGLARYAGPGGWNDPDMLEVGNGGMSTTEYQVTKQGVQKHYVARVDGWCMHHTRCSFCCGECSRACVSCTRGGWAKTWRECMFVILAYVTVACSAMFAMLWQAHFALWALLKSPLLIGADIRSMSNDTQAILLAKEVIALNQDKLGVG